MRRSVPDKILALVAGRTVFAHSLAAFIRARVADKAVITFRSPAQKRLLTEVLTTVPGADRLKFFWVRGGSERQDSVAAALAALPAADGLVFIHDCARPMVAPSEIRRLGVAARKHGAAVLAHRVTDTIKTSKPSPDRAAKLKTIDRTNLWAMETPQVFTHPLITRAYAAVRKRCLRVTDDTQAVELFGGRVAIVENRRPNPKITSPADIALVEYLLARAPNQ